MAVNSKRLNEDGWLLDEDIEGFAEMKSLFLKTKRQFENTTGQL